MKKTLYLFLCLLFTVTGLMGCSKDDSLDPEHPVTLSIWHVYGSQTESPLNDVIAEFNETVGKEKGIIVDVTSVMNSSAIDEMLLVSANDEPGSAALPNLFTAYPRVAEQIGTDRLLQWNAYFSEEELNSYVPDFLAEGYFDDQLLMMPIAKSTDLFFLNPTLFGRFSDESGIETEDLSDFAKLFAACNAYYDWSGGQTMFQLNEFYHYFLAGVTSLDGEFIKDGKINASSPAFEAVYLPMARAAIYGGLCVGDGFASDRWKTAEVISLIGSSASVLYLRDYVTYADNTTEDIETAALAYPVFSGASPTVIQRGVGLFATKSEDEKINEACAIFAKWVTQGQQNLDFVTKAGYLPVTNDTFETLFANIDMVENEKYRLLYETVHTMYSDYAFHALPLYENSGTVQSEFEEIIKSVLSAAHEEYLQRTAGGENSGNANDILEELAQSALTDIQQALK